MVWAIVFAGAALATREVAAYGGEWAVVVLWSTAILAGGAVEAVLYSRGGRDLAPSRLARWVLAGQANLSLVGLVLSGYLVWSGEAWALPGLWLLLVGHSFWGHGGLAFPAFRVTGALYQLGGVVALLPWLDPLPTLAATVAAGNLWMALSIWRTQRR